MKIEFTEKERKVLLFMMDDWKKDYIEEKEIGSTEIVGKIIDIVRVKLADSNILETNLPVLPSLIEVTEVEKDKIRRHVEDSKEIAEALSIAVRITQKLDKAVEEKLSEKATAPLTEEEMSLLAAVMDKYLNQFITNHSPIFRPLKAKLQKALEAEMMERSIRKENSK